MPYRIDLPAVRNDTFDRLVDLGALDIEPMRDGAMAALMPDASPPALVARAVGIATLAVSTATGRDADSVWILRPRPIHVGPLRIVPADGPPERDTLRLIDSPAFGTGLHPTTALCLEALVDTVDAAPPALVLDVGTGSGVLALAALMMGVPRALGIDVDDTALRAAEENARLNALADRLAVRHGGPDTVTGLWPLVLANVLAAPLIEMAPVLVRRVGRHGRLVLSGIPVSVEPDVAQVYRRLGMQHVRTTSRGGWVALLLHATW
jgi:ribosomal protein L11 methyltransferase